jgi:predicted ribosomally synthesized peptide with nif11-like leader
MSVENFDRFRELVVDDPALRDELRSIRDRAALREKAIALGQSRGFDFSQADVESVAQTMLQTWMERWLYQ